MRLCFLIAQVCLFALGRVSIFAAERPNVLVILTDDQGWGDLSLNGNTNLSTPHIDSLARDGAAFDRFYVCPVCAPTRAEFFTGRYHPRGGVRGVSTGEERFNSDETTIADTFKAANYATGAFGKWHNGTQWPYHPNARGFEEYYGFTSGHWGHYFSPPLDHNGEWVRGDGFCTDDFTNRAIDFIRQHKETPFFCYLPLQTPHSPFQVPDEYYSRFAEHPVPLRNRDPEKEKLDETRCVLAMCENIDSNVGRLLKALDDLKLAENTIVVFFTDNGPNTWRYNGGMKGRKGSTDEGGVRVPCLIRWPGKIPGGTQIAPIAGAIDLLPTLADLAGIPVVGDKPLDGRSLKPLLLGQGVEWPERTLFSTYGGRVSVRTQRYRLDDRGALFDMLNDPGQATDLAASLPDVTRRLRDAVDEFRQDVLSEPRQDNRPFPVGAGGVEFPLTQLPARDGRFSGNVERSGRAPNCSFFRNWTSIDDRIWWDADVAQAGLYEVSVLYACPADSVGSTFRLIQGDETLLSTRVTAAHFPPLFGEEADRADRGSESFVRDFKEWKLGRVRLNAGRHDLSLKADSVSGEQVMEVRMLMLRRVE